MNTEATKIVMATTAAAAVAVQQKKNRNCIKNDWIIMKWAQQNRLGWPVISSARIHAIYITHGLTLMFIPFWFMLLQMQLVGCINNATAVRCTTRVLWFCYDCCFCGPFFFLHSMWNTNEQFSKAFTIPIEFTLEFPK